MTNSFLAAFKSVFYFGLATIAIFAPPALGDSITFPLTPVNSNDIWTTSVYSYSGTPGGPGGGLNDEGLRVGGWGDSYNSLISFDLASLPKVATSARLELYPYADPIKTPIYVDRITESWNWKTQSTLGRTTPWIGADKNRLWWSDRPMTAPGPTILLPAPVDGQWYSVNITDIYNDWQAGVYPNYGIQLQPLYTDNRWSSFHSSEYSADVATRPRLIVETLDGPVLHFTSAAVDLPLPSRGPALKAYPHPTSFHQDLPEFLNTQTTNFPADVQASLASSSSRAAPLIDPKSDTGLKKAARIYAPLARETAFHLGWQSAIVAGIGGGISTGARQLAMWAGIEVTKEVFSQDPGADASIFLAQGLDTIDSCATGVNSGVAGLVSCLGSGVSLVLDTYLAPQLETYGNDPLDYNYHYAYSPFIPTTLPVPEDIREVLLSLIEMSSYLEAMNIAFDRYSGAYAAADELAAGLQIEAFLAHTALFSDSATSASHELNRLAKLIAERPGGGYEYDPSFAVLVQDWIRNNGFSSDTIAELMARGLDEEQIQEAKDLILSVDPFSIPSSPYRVLTIAAEDFARLSGMAAVAEPRSLALIILPLGVLALLGMRA